MKISSLFSIKIWKNWFMQSRFSGIIPDELFLRMRYEQKLGKKLNINNPTAFNEKLQWLKLYDRKTEYTTLVDKYRVRDCIKETLGEEYLIPLLGVYDNPDDIDFEKLPDKFVLKCNHNSGVGMCICKDKSKLDLDKVKKELRKGLAQNYYLTGREWPYKDVPRKIIAEQYIEDEDGELKDYKFMCFNGRVESIFVCSDRFSKVGLHVTFFDREWNVMPFERHYPHLPQGLPKPINLGKMIELAEELSKDIPFVRVDFYEVKGNVYFGELTFFPGGGYEEFTPEEWDYTMGSWLTLPSNKCI